MVRKYVIGWLPLVVIGIVNGVLRQVGYGKYVDELTAHQISTLTGIVLMGLYIWWLSGKWRIVDSAQKMLTLTQLLSPDSTVKSGITVPTVKGLGVPPVADQAA